jgi:hypothetical protein
MPKKKVVKVLHWLNTGIFPANVLFSCGFNYDELIYHLKKKKTDGWIDCVADQKEFIEESNYCYIASTITDTKTKLSKLYYCIIIRETFKFTDYDYCRLAHEVVHICQQVLKDVLDRNKECEAEAYLHSHLMMQCLKSLRG